LIFAGHSQVESEHQRDMKTLKELTDEHYALRAAADAYWAKHIEPRIRDCKTRAELRVVQAEVSAECADDKGQIREMPGHFFVNFALVSSGLPESI
jgi:hypothetical protein